MTAWQMVAAEGWAVRLHLFTVLPAFAIGTWLIFASRKGAPSHRRLGRLYMGLMAVTALAAVFVTGLNGPHWSWIHLFVPLTLGSVALALHAARRHQVRRHRGAMIGLYVGGLLVAGALTFAPGRLMHRLFFG